MISATKRGWGRERGHSSCSVENRLLGGPAEGVRADAGRDGRGYCSNHGRRWWEQVVTMEGEGHGRFRTYLGGRVNQNTCWWIGYMVCERENSRLTPRFSGWATGRVELSLTKMERPWEEQVLGKLWALALNLLSLQGLLDVCRDAEEEVWC